ncbi:MAG: hypothetical protein CNIPEHKO_02304 [Anaerolineales bacterium]|nr:hypothetical protein [Anaerolineales bacterium]
MGIKQMKESVSANISKLRFILIAIIFIGCVSFITSYITAKTIILTSPTTTLTPIYVTSTQTPTYLPVTQTQPSPTFSISTPIDPNLFRLEGTEVKSNLLKNNGFENGLQDWNYQDKSTDRFTYEIVGLNGKGVCSRQYRFNTSEWYDGEFDKQTAGLTQNVLIDPARKYYFSGWVKLNKAINVIMMVQFFSGNFDDIHPNPSWAAHILTGYEKPNGQTTNGWVFTSYEISHIPPGTTHALVGIWHNPIKIPPVELDSTICVDDLVFGEITK